jgi:hypothetical protein
MAGSKRKTQGKAKRSATKKSTVKAVRGAKKRGRGRGKRFMTGHKEV